MRITQPSKIQRRLARGSIRRGLTIVELLMALSITGIIGLATTAMLAAVSQGTSAGQDMRGVTVQRQRIANRLGTAIRESQAVLLAENTRFLLWVRDENGDGMPTLTELELIRLNGDRLESITAPATAEVRSFDIADDFSLAIANNLLIGTEETVVWAESVFSVSITTNGATPQNTSLVNFQVTFAQGGLQDIAYGSVNVRNELPE